VLLPRVSGTWDRGGRPRGLARIHGVPQPTLNMRTHGNLKKDLQTHK